MNRDFVPFELAKKLKEKGFNLETLENYIDKIKQKHLVSIDSGVAVVEVKDIVNTYPKPTISQVLKWLRKEKKIHIEVSPVLWTLNFTSKIYYTHKDGFVKHFALAGKEYNSWEEAVLDKMKYVIDKLI